MSRLRGVRAAAVTAVEQAQLTVVPHVPLLDAAEDWATSTGIFTFTVEDIASAVAAQADHALPTPVIKLGHVDPRFDGQPAFGRIINLAAENNGQTLFGDFAGVPVWLADGMETLYPRRSIEGQWGHTTKSGNMWRFALTAVALLGSAYPAITTLADIPLLLGAAMPAMAAAGVAPGVLEEPSVAAATTATVTVALRRR